jgi:hypothetical protein
MLDPILQKKKEQFEVTCRTNPFPVMTDEEKKNCSNYNLSQAPARRRQFLGGIPEDLLAVQILWRTFSAISAAEDYNSASRLAIADNRDLCAILCVIPYLEQVMPLEELEQFCLKYPVGRPGKRVMFFEGRSWDPIMWELRSL